MLSSPFKYGPYGMCELFSIFYIKKKKKETLCWSKKRYSTVIKKILTEKLRGLIILDITKPIIMFV